MKLVHYSFIGLLFLFSLSCDKLDNPIVPVEPVTADSGDYVRKMFFEDFTGHDCPNCPDGTKILDTILSKNENIIAIALHVGDLSLPTLKLPDDYRTTAGNFWSKHFKIGYWPAGMVNRKIYDPTKTVPHANQSNWNKMVAAAANEPFVLGLEPTVSFNESSRSITSSVKVKFKDAYNDSVRVSALLVEDGVIGGQNDAGDIIEDYEFKHMFRGTIADQDYWGQRIPGKKYSANSEHIVAFPSHTLKSGFKAENCYVVVIAFKESTREVLQVEKVKLKKD